MLTDNGEQYLQRYGKGTKGTGWYSFDQKGVHFVGLVNVANLKAGGLGSSATSNWNGWRTISRAFRQHADRAVRPHPAVDGLSGLGMGNGRQRAGTFIREALWLGHGAERPHSPDHAEDRRQRRVSHRDVNGVSSTRSRHRSFSRADEGSRRAIAKSARHHRREVRHKRQESCDRRLAAG